MFLYAKSYSSTCRCYEMIPYCYPAGGQFNWFVLLRPPQLLSIWQGLPALFP